MSEDVENHLVPGSSAGEDSGRPQGPQARPVAPRVTAVVFQVNWGDELVSEF